MRISFEIFPSKDGAISDPLGSALRAIEGLRPEFVSVTYGAGGSTQDRTIASLRHIVEQTSAPAAGHLTCVGRPRHEVDAVAIQYADAGVRRIVALRGDPATGPGTPYIAHPDGYGTGAAMVAGIKRICNLPISVSAYPEKHPESPSFDADLDALAAKVDAGADEALTQFFFDNTSYLRYLDRVRARRIDVPIVAGIMPIHDFVQISNFAGRCGTTIPARLARRFEGLEHDETTRRLVGANVAAEQVLGLVDAGITDFHFYTLNRPDLAYSLCRLLDIHPQPAAVTA